MTRSDSTRSVHLPRTMIAGAMMLTAALSSSIGAQQISIAPDPGFGYVPLSAFGIDAVAGLGDNTSHDFDLPAFLWSGQSYTSVSASSNGYLIVGGGDASSAVNQQLPDHHTPDNVLAPFWTDLAPGSAGSLRVDLLSDGADLWAVVDWERMEMAGDAALENSFQVWIGLNGVEDITYMYGDMAGSGGAPFTVGAENFDGNAGATWSFNGTGEPSPASGFGLRVSSTEVPNVMVPEPASLALLGLAAAMLVGVRVRRRAGRVSLHVD